MTTSDTMTGLHQPSAQPPNAGHRLLRRSRTDRVGAGVAGGLGEYFNVDPVLFRVLFATSAFFGGAGILAYVLAWAAIPEAGTARAPIDGWVAALRARRVPIWAVAIVGGLILWGVAFSWWVPGPSFPVVALVVVLIVFFSRRDLQASRTDADATASGSTPPTFPPTMPSTGGPADAPTAASTVSLDKADEPVTASTQPAWVHDARSWFEESRAAARERRRRALPVRVGVLVALIGTLSCLGIADAVGGIKLQWYFWSTLIVLGAGAVAGLVTRRWSWSVVPLVIPAAIGAVAFAGSGASLHDGIGQREWKPVTATSADYRLAFGQGILDLRDLRAGGPAQFDVTLGAGQVRLIVPRTMNVTVHADVHAGTLQLNGQQRHSGVEFTRVVDAPAGATGFPVSVSVHLTDGDLSVERK